MSSPETESGSTAAEGEQQAERPKLKLDIKVASPSACQRHVTVTIPRTDVDRFFDEAFSKLMPDAQVPGFRPGRAPRKLVEKNFKETVSEQVKGSLLMESMTQVNEECKFSAISEPDFDFDAITLPDEGPMTFEFDLEVRPDFAMPNWKGLKIEKPVREFTDADVDRHMVKYLERRATLEPFDGPAEREDYVVLKLTFTHEGKTVATADEHSVAVRPNLSFADGVLAGFDKLMLGAKAGDKRTGKVAVSHSAVNPEIREKTIDVELEVLEVKRKRLPELTESFLNDVFGSGIDAEGLRNYIRLDLHRQLAYTQQQRVREQITKMLTESATWDLPPEMLRRQSHRELERAVMELQSSGFTDDQIRARSNELKQDIQRWTAASLKEHFILERIAEDEKVEATESDFEEEIERIAAQMGESPRRVRVRLEKRNQMDALRNQVIERKVIGIITSHAQFKETPYTPDAHETSAIELAIGGEETNIPEAKHGGDAAELPQQVVRV